MAYGFKPVQKAGAGYNTGGFIELPVDGDLYGTAIFNGDTVQYNPNTTAATAGIAVNDGPLQTNKSVGVLVGARWTSVDGSSKWGNNYDGASTNTEVYAFVCPLEETVFVIQGDVTWDDKYIGWLNIPADGAGGSTITGLSSKTIALATTNGTQAPCVIVGVVRDGKNETPAVTTPNVLVRFIDAAIDQDTLLG
jgi:hypothetical protein